MHTPAPAVATGVFGQIVSRTGRSEWSSFLGATVAGFGFGFWLPSTTDPATTGVTSGISMVTVGIGIGLVMHVLVGDVGIRGFGGHGGTRVAFQPAPERSHRW